MKPNLLKSFLDKTGQICAVTWRRSCKVRANCPFSIEKEVSATVRAGINYNNLTAVQQKRESGELPEQNNGLPWGKWLVFPHVIEHKGNNYFRFYPFNGGKVVTQYFRDGERVDFAQVEPYLLASEKGEKTGDCFTVNESSILSLK